ncbi:MAG: IS4 family transposase [Candidatus Eisenbacteria bacterium]|nr:IS4 family transposase [Candidatus Eisenbacteria bacterium]
MRIEGETGWATEELADVDLGDKRLNTRLMKLCDSFSESPESPINQACADWAETKAAYRFFQNENVDVREILAAHRRRTAERARKHKRLLAIQDTSYFVYTNHTKTEGLGRISLKKGKNVEKIYSNGLVMHTCLAVTVEGLPLGLLDQKIFARKLRQERTHTGKGRKPHDLLPIEEKETYRWLEALMNTKQALAGTEVITVCDREADLYDFFKLSDQLGTPVLVRATANRTVNRKSRYAEKGVVKLWDHIRKQHETGSFTIEVHRRKRTKHCEARDARTATVTLRFGSFQLNPPRNNPKHKREELSDMEMYAVYVLEPDPPDGEQPVEWMLLTNLPVRSFAEAYEKVLWYCLRWRIEMYFKVLKSGFRVEACRLARAERLTRYLAVMSIVGWRLFMITLLARTDPTTPCTKILAEHEWRVLFLKVNKNKKLPKKTPPIREVVIWVARLGGFLARKGDGPPGTITLWRGWKRLADLTEGWSLAIQSDTCG